MKRGLAGARWMVLGTLAVGLSVAALSVLQYRSLLELEAKTRTAERENLRQVANAFVERVQADVQTIAGSALLGFRASDLRADNTPIAGTQFQAVSRTNRGIGEVFLFSLCPCKGEPFALFSTPGGAGWVKCQRFDEARVRTALDAYRSCRPFSARGSSGEELLFSQSARGLYVFRILSGSVNKREEAVFAGILLTQAFLTEELLPRAAAASAGKNVTLRVAEQERVVFTNFPDDRSGEVSVGFGAMLPGWEVATAYHGTSIDALAGRQFRRNFLLAAVVLAVLAAATLLMLRATAREARLAEMKSAFVSNVSHEMKTPLALIRMFAETLEMGRVQDRSKAQEYYRVIHNESRRLTRLIDSVLDFARMEGGRKEYEFAPGDAAAIVEEVASTYREQMLSAGFELTTDIASQLPLARADANALAEAVLSLLDNAVKYSAETKSIEIRAYPRDGEVAIEVADRGIGIPKSEQERIFEKFYRVNTGLVHDVKGSGLGLTLAKHIVEAHGGRILVDSAPGRGSRFTILLPAGGAHVETAPAHAMGAQTVAEGLDYRG